MGATSAQPILNPRRTSTLCGVSDEPFWGEFSEKVTSIPVGNAQYALLMTLADLSIELGDDSGAKTDIPRRLPSGVSGVLWRVISEQPGIDVGTACRAKRTRPQKPA
jgi:hypothetical protein